MPLFRVMKKPVCRRLLTSFDWFQAVRMLSRGTGKHPLAYRAYQVA